MSVAAVRAAPLFGKSLVLNRSFLPISVTPVPRAVSLLYRGVAVAVDAEYRTFDFPSWADISAAVVDSIGLVDGMVRVPRVILLLGFDRVPRRRIRFSRHNIFLRDRDTCQYCGTRPGRSGLNLDHVIPRVAGGPSTWENVVCSCIPCNRRKGGRSPQQAGMVLSSRPQRPDWNLFIASRAGGAGYREWRPFLTGIDTAYWNAELVPE